MDDTRHRVGDTAADVVTNRAAMAEAATARLVRCLLSIADRLTELSLDSAQDPLHELVGRIGSTLRAERILLEIGSGEVSVRAGLERFLLARQLASPSSREVVTSFAADQLAPAVAASVAAALTELVAVVDDQVDDLGPGRVYVATGHRDGEVVVAFAAEAAACEGIAAGGEAWVSLCRAERLVHLAGGALASGDSGGRMVVGMMLPPGSRDGGSGQWQ